MDKIQGIRGLVNSTFETASSSNDSHMADTTDTIPKKGRTPRPRKSLVDGLDRKARSANLLAGESRRVRQGTGRSTTQRAFSVTAAALMSKGPKNPDGFDDMDAAFASSSKASAADDHEEVPSSQPEANESALNASAQNQSEIADSGETDSDNEPAADADHSNGADEEPSVPEPEPEPAPEPTPAVRNSARRSGQTTASAKASAAKSAGASAPPSASASSASGSSRASTRSGRSKAFDIDDVVAEDEHTPAKRLSFDDTTSPEKKTAPASSKAKPAAKAAPSSSKKASAASSSSAAAAADDDAGDDSVAPADFDDQPDGPAGDYDNGPSPIHPRNNKRRSVASEEESGDEKEKKAEPAPAKQPPAKKTKTPAAAAAPAAAKRPRPKSDGSKKSRRSTLLLVQEAEEAGIEDLQDDQSDTRRSKRRRFQPFKYWLNEAPVYERADTGFGAVMPVIKEIAKPSAEDVPRRPASGPRAASKPKKPKSKQDDSSDDEKEDSKKPPVESTSVYEFRTKEHRETAVVKRRHALQMNKLPMPVPDGQQPPKAFPLAGKFFDEKDFSSGILELPPGAVKFQETTVSIEIFYVISAERESLELKLNDLSVRLSKHDSFHVPIKNEYMLCNHSKTKSAKLHFSLFRPRDFNPHVALSASAKKGK